MFPIADGTVKLYGWDQLFGTSTSIQDNPERCEEFRDGLRGGSDQPKNTKDDGEARHVFWSIEGTYIHHHYVEPGVKLHVPKEESFSMPLRYIDFIRRTHTTLDVLQESRMDDYGNHDGDRNLSESWTGLRSSQCKMENLYRRRCVVRGAADKKFKQLPDLVHLWPEMWSGMSKSSTTKGKAAAGCRGTEAGRCAKVERHLFLTIWAKRKLS